MRGMAPPTRTGNALMRGFTYIGLLLMIAIAGIGLSTVGISWQYRIRSEKEAQLLFVGDQFRRAFDSYYESAPDGAKVYPQKLEDLLLDKRFPKVKRHLRKLYPDPMTGSTQWGLVRAGGRIVGIYSLDKGRPIKKAGFKEQYLRFASASSYQSWKFGVDSGSGGTAGNSKDSQKDTKTDKQTSKDKTTTVSPSTQTSTTATEQNTNFNVRLND